MTENTPADTATVAPGTETVTPAPPVTAPPAPAAPEPENEWEGKYQGQLKVNRDLEKKLDDERKARAALELEGKPADEQAAAKLRAEVEAEVTSKANGRILRAELRALATGKLADPSDAALYLNLDDFSVTDDGEVDSAALTAAITDLLKRKPHLAAGDPTRFDGAGDGGAGAPPKPNESLDDAIAAARAARNFSLVATLQTQKAAEAAKKG